MRFEFSVFCGAARWRVERSNQAVRMLRIAANLWQDSCAFKEVVLPTSPKRDFMLMV